MPSEEKKKSKGILNHLKVRYKPNADKDESSIVSEFDATTCIPSEMDLTGQYQIKVVQIPDESGQGAEQTPQPVNWQHRISFMLHYLGFSAGLGNIWRFPTKMYQNGKGAFLVVYLLILCLVGLPLFFLELVLGQYLSRGPIKVFGRMAPLFKGLGYSMIAMVFCLVIYYNVINFWCILWFCKGVFGLTEADLKEVSQEHGIEQFYSQNFLGLNGTVHSWANFGELQWEMVLCCLAAWIIIAFFLWSTLHQIPYVVYFNNTFPVLLLFVFAIIGFCLDGSWEHGVKPMLDIQPSHFGAKVWKEAALQVFFSLGLCIGNLMNLGRTNPNFRNNCLRDAWLIVIGDTLIALLSALVVFLFTGYVNKANAVQDLGQLQGPSSGFLLLMSGVTKWSQEFTGGPQLGIGLFSAAIMIMGFDCVIVAMTTIIDSLTDGFKFLREKKQKVYLTIGICIFFFLLSLPYCASGGYYLFTLMDDAVFGNNVLFIAFVEIILVGVFFGMDKIFDCVKEMNISFGRARELYFRVSLQVLVPLALLALFSENFLAYNSDEANDVYQATSYTYYSEEDATNDATDPATKRTCERSGNLWECTYSTAHMEYLHLMIQFFTVSPIFLSAAWAVFENWKNGLGWKKLVQPTEKWKPADDAAKPVLQRKTIFDTDTA